MHARDIRQLAERVLESLWRADQCDLVSLADAEFARQRRS